MPLPSKCANATAPDPLSQNKKKNYYRIKLLEDILKHIPECLTTTIMHVVASSDPIIFTFLSCVATAANSLWPTYNSPTGPTFL